MVKSSYLRLAYMRFRFICDSDFCTTLFQKCWLLQIKSRKKQKLYVIQSGIMTEISQITYSSKKHKEIYMLNSSKILRKSSNLYIFRKKHLLILMLTSLLYVNLKILNPILFRFTYNSSLFPCFIRNCQYFSIPFGFCS